MKPRSNNMSWMLFVGILLQSLSSVSGDIVYLHDGGSIEGKVRRRGDKVLVEFHNGSMEFHQKDIKRIEVLALPQKIFAEKLSKVGNDADACVKLARWALAKNLTQEYVLGLRRSLQIDRQHPVARSLLRDYQHRLNYLPENYSAGDQLAAEMRRDFVVIRTHHYRICYNSSDVFAEISGELLEKVYDQFVYFFTDRQFDPAPITDRLEVVLFDTREQYVAYAKKIKAEFAHSAGFFESTTGRCYFYDTLNTGQFYQQRNQLEQVIAESKRMQDEIEQNRDAESYVFTGSEGKKETISRDEALRRLDRDQANIDGLLDQLRLHYDEANITTSVHEAVHQLAWQCGIQSRTHETPLWLSEGMATYFEAANRGQWNGPGEVHRHRLKLFLVDNDSEKYISLYELVSTDKLFQLDQSRAGDAYAASWALFYYLSEQYHEELFDYIYDLSLRIIPGPYSRNERFKDIEGYFGDRNDLERRWRYLMADLRSP
jgi:hypothetical protein